jgi:hypothetical protein
MKPPFGISDAESHSGATINSRILPLRIPHVKPKSGGKRKSAFLVKAQSNPARRKARARTAPQRTPPV